MTNETRDLERIHVLYYLLWVWTGKSETGFYLRLNMFSIIFKLFICNVHGGSCEQHFYIIYTLLCLYLKYLLFLFYKYY